MAIGGNIVGSTGKIYIGITCPYWGLDWQEEYKDEHQDLKDNLNLAERFAGEGWRHAAWWVWYRETSYGFDSPEHLAKLSQDEERERIADSVAQELERLWKKAHGEQLPPA